MNLYLFFRTFMTQAKLLIMCLWIKSHLLSVTARKPFLKKLLIFLGWLHNKEVFLALCQNVENGCAREVLMPVSLRSSFWHQQVVTNSWCEIKYQLVFGAHRILHAMAKGNVRHYIGQTKPVDHPALWIRVEVNHIHRMIFRLKAAVFIVLKKLLQSEFIFIFLNRRETDINFDLPWNSLCYTTKRRQAFSRRSCDTRKFVGTLAYNNRFWRAPVAKLGSNIVHIQHIKIICGRRCCCKHMLLEFHRTNFDSNWGKRTEVCWVRSDALHGSLQLFLDRDFGCPRRCFFESSAISWTSTASAPVRVSSDETSLLSPREARVSSLNWSDSSLEKGELSSARDRRSGVSGTNGSKTALWSTRFALSSTVPEDVVGFCSKNVKVVAVWEVLVVAGARWYFFLCRVRSKLRVVVVPQNSHSKILFWRSET